MLDFIRKSIQILYFAQKWVGRSLPSLPASAGPGSWKLTLKKKTPRRYKTSSFTIKFTEISEYFTFRRCFFFEKQKLPGRTGPHLSVYMIKHCPESYFHTSIGISLVTTTLTKQSVDWSFSVNLTKFLLMISFFTFTVPETCERRTISGFPWVNLILSKGQPHKKSFNS